MALQSACVPIPSEVIICPSRGFALAHSQLRLCVLATLASLASNIGSIPAYYIGSIGGQPLVERYGSYVLLSGRDLALTERFFAKFGSAAVLIGRMLPIVRHIYRATRWHSEDEQSASMCIQFLGSWPWCYALAYAGMKLGDHCKAIRGSRRYSIASTWASKP